MVDKSQSVLERDLNNELRQFSESETFYKHALTRQIFTEGVHYVRETYRCFWLIDDILLYGVELKKEPFQVWTLKRVMTTEDGRVKERTNAFTLSCDDGNKNVLRTIQIPFSDFPGDSIKFYLIEGVLLLPSEY